VVAALLLSGCSAEYVKRDAEDQLRDGQLETAWHAFDKALARDPENAVLRAGQISTQDAILARLFAQAGTARASGDLDTAARLLARALALQPNSERAAALVKELELDRSLAEALRSAKDLAARGMREQALLVIDAGLKSNPQHAGLLAMRRQWEQEARQMEQTVTNLSVPKPISLDFRDANLRMVLDVLTRNSGINFLIDKDVRADLRTTVLMRDARFADALELITGTAQLGYKAIDNKTVLIYPKTPDKIKEYQDLLIRAFYLNSAEARQTATMLKTMLKIREPYIDEKLNMIMVRETPDTIRMAERLIALHDMAEPEVMLELEVLELQTSSLTELGIDYPDGFTLTPIPPNKASSFTLGNVKDLNRDAIGINLPPVPVKLHRDVGNANLLANPKIRARNHEKARILIGDKLPIVTTTGSAANSGFISESVQYVDVGLKLDVEPTVYLDDEVSIKIGLEVSSLERSVTTASGSLVYQLGTRNTNTTLRLRDGQTQLLAGLINKQERMSANRVPGLGDLPMVGRLFASQRDDNGRTEIVLSVTPHVVRNIRRPELYQTEFWSGTENEVHSRALTFPRDEKGPAEVGAKVAPTEEGAVPPAPLVLKVIAPKTVKPGETFAAHVVLAASAPLRGMPLQLEFSNQTLELLDMEAGAFFSQDGTAVSKTQMLEQAAGRGAMTQLRNSSEGVKGEGTVLSMHLKALQAGDAKLRLVSAKPIATPPLDGPAMPPEADILIK
jgi:general secretion pathway protein D